MLVLLIFGGNSSENEVSKKSAKSIIQNIDTKEFTLECTYIDRDGVWYQCQADDILLDNYKYSKIENIIKYLKKFDVIFPIIHGTNGEDGKLQGLLELFNIPFVGCKTTSSAIGMDKGFSKMIFDYLGIKQIPFTVIDYNNYNYLKIIKDLQFPLIIKPSNGGSSIGISKANNHIELIKAIKEASNYDKRIVIEEFRKVRELECAVLEDKKIITSVIGEIIPTNEFYDYEAKYVNDSKLVIPANIPKKIQKEISKISKMVFKKLNCSGLSRVDFLYDEKNNEIFLNEINTLPGFTIVSMFPKLLTYNKITYKHLITKIIKSSIK